MTLQFNSKVYTLKAAVHVCTQGHSQQWSRGVLLTCQTLATFPHVCPQWRGHLRCDVFIPKNTTERRETIVAPRNNRDESQKQKGAAPIRMLWGTGGHLSLDWGLVSRLFNLKQPTEIHTDVPCTLLDVCTQLPSHFKNT